MNLSTRIRLSVMMFLNFFIWGSWFVTMGTFLVSTPGVTNVQVGLAYGTQSLGAIAAPFLVGLIADRFFAAQRILGVLHLAGAALLLYLSTVRQFGVFYPIILIYMVLYMPTLALVNAVAFRQMARPEAEFSYVRVWGTIGWVVAGVIIGRMGWEQSGGLHNTFKVAGVCAAAMGLFSFTLPNTPPGHSSSPATIANIAGAGALALLKDRNFLVFFLSSMLICIPLAFYYQETNIFLNELKWKGAAGKMALGQVSEAIFLFLMPLFFLRLGVKKMLLIGMGAWVARYLLFAFGNTGSQVGMLYTAIILHGICYDFFFVTGQVYTNQRAGEHTRSSAQGMITLATYGIGMLIGFWVAGLVADKYATPGGHQWQLIWIVPAAIAAAVFVFFAVLFNNRPQEPISAAAAEMALGNSPGA